MLSNHCHSNITIASRITRFQFSNTADDSAGYQVGAWRVLAYNYLTLRNININIQTSLAYTSDVLKHFILAPLPSTFNG